jgi:hypothetical protein
MRTRFARLRTDLGPSRFSNVMPVDHGWGESRLAVQNCDRCVFRDAQRDARTSASVRGRRGQTAAVSLAHPERLAIRALRIALAFVSIRSEVRAIPSLAQARSTMTSSLAFSGSSRRCAASPRAPKTVVRRTELSTGTSTGCPSASVIPTP